MERPGTRCFPVHTRPWLRTDDSRRTVACRRRGFTSAGHIVRALKPVVVCFCILYCACNLGRVGAPRAATLRERSHEARFTVSGMAQTKLLDARYAGMPGPVRWYLINERAILGALSFVGFFAFWEIGSNLGSIDAFFFSSPSRILDTAWAEVQNPRLWSDLQISGTELLLGYVSAVALAVPLGVFVGWYRKLNYLVDPWLNFMNALPRVALMPLIVLWVGIGIWSKVVVVFLGVFFTVIINTLYGVRTADKRLLDVAASFRAPQWRVFSSVVLPGSVPFILAGLRLGIARGLIGVLVGELYSSNAGIGYMITAASQTLQTSRLLFGVILLTLMGVIGVEMVRILERRFEKWRPKRDAR